MPRKYKKSDQGDSERTLLIKNERQRGLQKSDFVVIAVRYYKRQRRARVSCTPSSSANQRESLLVVNGVAATATMGVARKESGVLKLVHPGGFVEVHRKSVSVSEVMAKNPRHCVTRPEVFKNPRLVLRPDARLNTGDVFYIVPNHTVYRLLQASSSSSSS